MRSTTARVRALRMATCRWARTDSWSCALCTGPGRHPGSGTPWLAAATLDPSGHPFPGDQVGGSLVGMETEIRQVRPEDREHVMRLAARLLIGVVDGVVDGAVE